jgi:hypothetical protein
MECAFCGEPLSGPGRSDRLYCGVACRKAAHRRRKREREAPELIAPEPAGTKPGGSLDREALIEEALSEPRLVVYVAAAAKTNWRAAAWLLEHRHPERWGRDRELEPAVPPGGDPFAEVDQLAARRRLHHIYD